MSPNKAAKNKSLPENLLLDLPDSHDYKSYTPELTYIKLMKLCEQELPYTNLKRKEDDKKFVNFEPFTFKD